MQGIGRLALSIPPEHLTTRYEIPRGMSHEQWWIKFMNGENPPLKEIPGLYDKYPELASNDPDVYGPAFKKFIASSESRPYRVNKRV